MTTEPEHVHYWQPTGEANEEYRTFSLADGSRMTDRKGRTVGCLVRVRPMALPLGTGWGVTIQAARDGRSFGASFPNEYHFLDTVAAAAHVETSVGQAQARQRRQHRAGKL